ncbi:MAG: TonB-dependent receptor [Acidobacteria bacterium]|nr:TonB-dependent receptor [Acidobacteriota bacterium]
MLHTEEAMRRQFRAISATLVGIAGFLLGGLPAKAQDAGIPAAAGLQVRLTTGSISGTVYDERGSALSGAMVSALGGTLSSTVTDADGRFTLAELPVGEYFLRAHLLGFAASRSATVRVGVTPAVHRFELRRLESAVGTSGVATGPVKARPIIAAGFDLPLGLAGEAAEESAEVRPDDHSHTETAYRLRHIKRSILKDAGPIVVLTERTELSDGSVLGRAVGSAAGIATALFTDFPFSGEVNFLTTGAIAPGAVLPATAFPRGVAYLALAAPAAGGDWSIRAAMSEGDLSSWLVSSTFLSKPAGSHTYDFGLSYSTQEYFGGNPAALTAVSEGNRNIGELYGFDNWTFSRSMSVDYGARYVHYDYLEDRGRLSPRLGFTVEPFRRTRVRAGASQRMVVPGAEEFLSTSAPGPSLPPERTFAPLGAPDDREQFRVERARTYDLRLERDLGADFVISVSRFQQSVDDQIVTLFGLHAPEARTSPGHYYVGSVGSFDADGWVVRLETPPSARFQGSVQYSATRARWTGQGKVSGVLPIAPAAIRPDFEDLHDLTGSFRADISETATRLFVLYKLNSGYILPTTALDRPGLDGRFELQMNQALPVGFAGTRWELLVGVRNLFRDPTDPASVYDELLVVKPPLRLVGGFLVRF